MANFDDLQGAVAQFGANNKVIFDDTGMPSIMVAVPKAKYRRFKRRYSNIHRRRGL